MITPLEFDDKTLCKSINQHQSIEQKEEITNKITESRKTSLIQDYVSEKNDLNAQRESDIRGKVQWLIQKLLLIEEAVQSKMNCLENRDCSLITKQDFIDVWIKCKEIRYDAGICIETFFEDCYSCEKKYSFEAEKLIKRHYEALRRLVKNFPKDMFEQDILNMNAQLLNNIREYANFSRHVVLYQLSRLVKMKLGLASKLESWISMKAQEAERLKETEQRIASLEDKGSFQYFNKHISQSYIQKQKQKFFLNFLCDKDKRSEFTWDYFLDDTTEDWPDQLQTNECDFVLELLIKTYSIAKAKSGEALRLLIDSFDTICSEISQTDGGSNVFGQSIEQQHQLLQTSVSNEVENPLDNIHNKVIAWHNATCKMQKKIGKAFRFIADFAKIWTEHLQRLKDTKSLIAVVLGKDVEAQLERRRSNQAGMIMAIANVRVESNEKFMEQHLQKISKLIIDTEESCREELTEEINTLEKFREFAQVEGRLLGAEFCRLQEKYTFEQQITYFSEQSDPTETDSVTQLPKHLQLCDLHTTAMENWNTALMLEICKYHQICEKDVSIRMENWMIDESYGLLDRLDGYIHMESKQYNRIVEQVYNVRLTELRNHQMSLELHKNAVESYLSQIFQDLEHFFSIFSNTIETSKSYFNEVEIITEESENSSFIENLVTKLNNKRIKEEYIFENAILHFKEQSNRKFRYLQECQLNFIKSLKMISEAGTYSSEETQLFLNELMNTDKLIITKQTAFDTELSNCCAVLKQDMNECYSNISQYLVNALNELKFTEETTLILSEAEKSLKVMFNNLQKDGNRVIDEFKTIILILLNELQASPTSHLLEALENFMMKSRKRALRLLSPYNKRSMSSTGNKGKSHSIIKKGKERRSNQKITGGKSKFTDYRKLFPEYTEPYLEEIPFVSIVYREIGSTVSSLQEKARLFYTSRNTQTSLIKVAVPTTYDDFMRQCTELFQNYCKLCLDACNKEMLTLFQLLSKLRQAADLYVAKRLVEFHGAKIQKLMKVYSQFESERLDLLKEDRSIREKCKRKLLVVHGYPSNKNLLKELEQEIESTCSDLEAKISLFIMKGRKYLCNIKKRYLDRVTAICKTLELFQENIFEADIFCSLAQQLRETLRETSQSVLSSDAFVTDNEPLRLESELQYLLTEGIKEGNIAFIKDCLKSRRKALLQEMQCAADNVTNINDFSHSPSIKLVFPEPVKIQNILSSMTKHYLNEFEQHHKKMDFFESYKSLSSEWMKEWRSSIRSAQMPYCV